MTNVLILGANGQIARHVIAASANDQNVKMTLFMRSPARLLQIPANAHSMQGDVLDNGRLASAARGQEIVYANLTGDDIDEQAKSVIKTMQEAGVRRLIFVLALGIYDEVPGKFGEWNNSMIGDSLKPFRRAADAIEASPLDYTIIRPAWLTDHDEVDYETTTRDEPFRGTEVSRKSVASFIADLIRNPSREIRGSLGINKPGTDGDKPAFM